MNRAIGATARVFGTTLGVMRGALNSRTNNDAYHRRIHSLVMPSFDLEFEVFCGTCGAGLCNQSDTRKSRRRGEAQVTVEVCQTCIEKAETPLRERIEELEQLLEEAKLTDTGEQAAELKKAAPCSHSSEL